MPCFLHYREKMAQNALAYATYGESKDTLFGLQFCFSVDFKPHASMDTVHHMLLFGCNEPCSTESYW